MCKRHGLLKVRVFTRAPSVSLISFHRFQVRQKVTELSKLQALEWILKGVRMTCHSRNSLTLQMKQCLSLLQLSFEHVHHDDEPCLVLAP